MDLVVVTWRNPAASSG